LPHDPLLHVECKGFISHDIICMDSVHMKTPYHCWLAAVLWLAAFPYQTVAQDAPLDDCLRTQVTRPENVARTVAELRRMCNAALASAATPEAGPAAPARRSSLATELDNSYFQPYKNNYIVFGSMRNRDGEPPFSGQDLDIRFELGMQFSLFPHAAGFTLVEPIKFGYSQRSWWDISESSSPFKEHNYNPEVFWDFARAREVFGRESGVALLDQAGYEHQSNGRDGPESRSWDRVYVQKHFRYSEMFAWTVKIWDVVNLGEFNKDIEDYLGNVEITTHLDLNNWAKIELRTSKGDETSKISYQLDLSIPMTRWVNSRFFISYYDGYGEALISYDRKSRSLRTGFHFPLGF